MGWDVEFTGDFEDWWNDLTESEQESVAFVVDLLALEGPMLSLPYSRRSKEHGSLICGNCASSTRVGPIVSCMPLIRVAQHC